MEGRRVPVETLGLPGLERALLVFAHPDDEINAVGLVLRLRAAGVSVELLVLTDGAANPWTDETVVAGRTHLTCRTEELRASMSLLGVDGLTMPALPDSKLQAHLAAATDVVSRTLARGRPGLVVTFDARGVNGHPDHMAAHAAVRTALRGAPASPALAMLLPPPPFSWALGAGFRWQQTPTVATLTLREDELETKARAFEAHRSQQRTLRLLTAGVPPRTFFRRFPREWFLWLSPDEARAWALDEASR
ncbi:MAG: PIG-L deacetylase family protein [Myxococcaceae bacterium]|nr:PIG-L deacetylase family protein [Myxococcaceae bacterium]